MDKTTEDLAHRDSRRKAAERRVPSRSNGEPDKRSASEPLRQEAERAWADADRTAAQGERRRIKRGQAITKRRRVSGEKDREISRLTQELDDAKRKLTQRGGRRRKHTKSE
jgi:hypothetical protein